MRDEYDFEKSKQNPYAKKFDDIVESSWLNSLAKLVKKFKSSKSYWSVSRIVILFSIREALAWKWGSAIEAYAQKQLEGTDYGWLWTAVEFVFGIGGSWELALGGLIVFVILSLVKVSEGENNTITLKESFLSLLLLFTLVGMGIYAISTNNTKHDTTHKEQKITHAKLDEIKALIKLQGGDETLFLEKYFGKDYAIILKHPQTYHNFTTLLKQTNKTADELLKEREVLLKKIKSKNFTKKLQNQIDKAFKELRYADARKLIDDFLKVNRDKEQDIIKAHYIKALSFMEQIRYSQAKDEFEKIPFGINNPNILSDYAEMYYILGKYDKAIEFYEKVLKITFSPIIDYHPSILNIYDHIGLAWDSKGEYDKALRYYEKSLKIRLLSLRKNHPDIAVNYINIGLVWHKKGKSNKADEYYKKSNKIILSYLEKKELDISIYYQIINYYLKHNKVIIYYERELKYQETLPKIYLEKKWESYKDKNIMNENNASYKKDKYDIPLICSTEYNNIPGINLDKKNQYVASIYEITGSSCYRLGMYDKALKYYEKSLKIELTILGENHPETATIYENIGSTWDSKDEYDQAFKYYEKSLKIRFYTLGENHPDTAISYHYIGSICYRKGEYKKAIEYYKRTLKILKQVFLNGHPYIDITTKSLKRAKENLKNQKNFKK